MKDKRGISPVVATVLLVAIVVVVGIIIFIWASGIFGEQIKRFGSPITDSCDSIAISASYEDSQLQISNDDSSIPLYNIVIYTDDGGSLTPNVYGSPVNLAPGTSIEIPVDSGTPKQISPILKGTKSESEIEYTCDKRKIDVTDNSIVG